MPAHPQITVLHPLSSPSKTPTIQPSNPYVRLTVDSLPGDRIRSLYWSWPRAIFGRYDVIHLHWPEELAHAPGRTRRWANRLALLALATRLKVTRTKLVRTVHNLKPHEQGSSLANFLVEYVERQTSHWVVLNSVTPTPEPSRTTLIPHGHYKDWYTDEQRAPRHGQLINFGLIREYKGIDDFVGVLSSTPGDISLVVAGRVDDDSLAARIRAAADDDPRIRLDFRYVPDEELAAMVLDSELVVLPYRDVFNSGAALLALSLGRPILCPRTRTTEQLVAEFGEDWVITYQPPLDPDKLGTAIRQVQQPERAPEPDLSSRDWNRLGERLAAVYESVIRK